MSTLMCMRLWTPNVLPQLGATITTVGASSRLISSISSGSFSQRNLKPQIQDNTKRLCGYSIATRNLSLSTARFKDIFKRDKPHVNIGKITIVFTAWAVCRKLRVTYLCKLLYKFLC